MIRVAVVGAGAGGLAAAHDLVRAGCSVTIFEADDQVGGLASGFRQPRWDWTVEKYYHHWFASDRDVLGLIEELGWSEQVLFPWPVTAVYYEGAFYPLDGPLSLVVPALPWLDRLPGAGMLARVLHLLRFPGLGAFDTLRAGLVGLYLTLTGNWRPFERVTADAWLRRTMGERVYKVLWEPLLVGKFGPYYQQVNMAWFWARVKARTARLGTFEGGFQAFMDALAAQVQAEGAKLLLRTPVERIEPLEDGRLMVRFSGSEESFDHCLVTLSPRLMARMAPSLPESYLEGLFGLRSMGAVVMLLALKHRLSEQGVYWHNLPKSAGFPFLALVEHTNYLSPAFFGGDHLVYCGDYLDPDHEYFRLTKEELLERFMPALERVNPNFRPDWVRDAWLSRTPYAQPVPPLNHSRHIPPLKTPILGLWMANMSQVYPWDRGTNFAVEIGRRAAREILAARTERRA